MKYIVIVFATLTFLCQDAFAQQYKVITTVESIVPMGIGRSRIIDHKQNQNLEQATTERDEGNKSDQKKVKRKDLKIDNLDETKLLNFYSGVGINFRNIASNDAMISAKINELINDGWQLEFVTSGVESSAGEGDNNGIFITRYIFKK
ncbi:MAG: hypothetical protein HKO56_04935 [Bacteroidia bacterium]|nr:hypothetical protein [Bacteroidia bacterium]NNM15983.1 hypothetical protein [Bacteroidia bacterium]